MTLIWLTAVFNYFMLKFLINTFQQVYVTGLLSSFSGLFAYWHGGLLYKQLGLQRSLTLCFSISLLASLAIFFHGLNHQKSSLFPLEIVAAEYGVAASFTIIYVAHPSIFPVLFAATALGYVNFASRFMAALAPVVA